MESAGRGWREFILWQWGGIFRELESVHSTGPFDAHRAAEAVEQRIVQDELVGQESPRMFAIPRIDSVFGNNEGSGWVNAGVRGADGQAPGAWRSLEERSIGGVEAHRDRPAVLA
jgi:hypothetical protein